MTNTKTNTTLLKVILLFSIAILLSFIGDYLHDFLGD